MSAKIKGAERRLMWAIRLLLVGLVVELFSLFGLTHPMGFMVFATFGCSLMVLGVLLFFSTMIPLSKLPPSPE